MRFLRPWRGIRELESFPPAAQKRLWREFELEWLFGGMDNLSWVGIAYIFGVGIVCALTMEFVLKPNGFESPVIKVCVVVVALVVGYIPVRLWIVGPRMRQWIRHHLHHDFQGGRFPFCVQCGYNLKGCKEDVASCPECGNEEIRGNPARAPDQKNIIKF